MTFVPTTSTFRSRWPRALPLLMFLGLWLLIGFAAGTVLLLGPVRWFVELCRQQEWPSAMERAGVFVIILFLFLGSAATAWLLLVRAVEERSVVVRTGIAVIPLMLASIAVWSWMQPGRLRGSMGGETTFGRVTYGPYPDEKKLVELRAQGYTIVSLLHPAVVPFEPRLLAQEREETARLGMRFISIPMLPWVSENTEALQELRELTRDKEAKYYIHCYLGRDRIRIVQRVLGHLEPGVTAAKPPKGAGRTLADVELLERGGVVHLGHDGYVIGYPTDEEFLWFILDGSIHQVVSLLDPANPEDAPWVNHETAVLRKYDMPLLSIPICHDPYDPAAMVEAAKRVRSLPKPFAVHAFLSPTTGRGPMAEAFVQAYRTGRPSLPPSLFGLPLQRGNMSVIVPQVATGPRPAATEFWVLRRRGVREFVFIGDGNTPAAAQDRTAAAGQNLPWRAVGDSSQALEAVAGNGPYYLYGDVSRWTKMRLRLRYGPPVPKS